ncbi:unnamed protein product, partial [Trichobilharzia szidati]
LTMNCVKVVDKFGDFVKQLPDLAAQCKGILTSATQYFKILDGIRGPNYVLSSQWREEEDFHKYLTEGERCFFIFECQSLVEKITDL